MTDSGPSARTARASSTEESTPPEKATPNRRTPGSMMANVPVGLVGVEVKGGEHGDSFG